jgi:hypothetical protein
MGGIPSLFVHQPRLPVENGTHHIISTLNAQATPITMTAKHKNN